MLKLKKKRHMLNQYKFIDFHYLSQLVPLKSPTVFFRQSNRPKLAAYMAPHSLGSVDCKERF